MGRKQKEMSEYEWKQMKRFVSQLCEKFGKGLDQEECEGTAYLEYAEARGEAGNIYDRDFLWERARERTIKAFQQLRRERSGWIRIESKLSLDQPAGESGEPVYTFLHANHGDFVRWVLLRTDLAKFGETEYKIITGLERCAILVREEFSCLEFIMNRDTINWILKKLNTGGRTWSIYQRKSTTTASATR